MMGVRVSVCVRFANCKRYEWGRWSFGDKEHLKDIAVSPSNICPFLRLCQIAVAILNQLFN